jgi:hypothetical protein
MICMEHTAKLDRTIVTSGALSLLLIQKLLSSIAPTSSLFPCSSPMQMSTIIHFASISMMILVAMGTKEVSMGLIILLLPSARPLSMQLIILLMPFANPLSMQLMILLLSLANPLSMRLSIPLILIQKAAFVLLIVRPIIFEQAIPMCLGILPLLFGNLLFVRFSMLLPILTCAYLASRLQPIFGRFVRAEVFSGCRKHLAALRTLLFWDILRYTVRHSTRSNVVLSASGCYPLRWYQHRFSIAGAKNISRYPHYTIILLLQQGKGGAK